MIQASLRQTIVREVVYLRRMLPILCLVLVILLGITACNQQSLPRQRDDSLQGITNANPNLRTGDRYTPTVSDDRTRIRNAALGTDGVRDVRVALVGGRALVRVIPQPDLPRSEYGSLRETVRQNVSTVMPRYEIRVAILRTPGFRWPIVQ